MRYQGSGVHADQGDIPTLNVWQPDNSSTVTILDDGDAGTVLFGVAEAYVHEQNGTAADYVVTITRVGRVTPSAAITVNISTVNGSAVGGQEGAMGMDFVESQGLLSFPDGANTSTFVVTIVHDDLYEVSVLHELCCLRPGSPPSPPPSTRTSCSSWIWRTCDTWTRPCPL